MAFPTKNYYEVLGISPQAQKPEIKDAYKKMALRCHPDKNPGKSTAVAIFQQVFLYIYFNVHAPLTMIKDPSSVRDPHRRQL